jgi:hypothetical protein
MRVISAGALMRVMMLARCDALPLRYRRWERYWQRVGTHIR